MKNFKNFNRNNLISDILFSYFSVLLLTFSRTLKIDGNSTFLRIYSMLSVFNTETLLGLVLFGTIFFITRKLENFTLNKKENRVLNVFSMIFALIFTVGTDITYHHGIFRNSTDKLNVFLFFIIFFISIYVFKNVLKYLYKYLLNIRVEFSTFQKWDKLTFRKIFLPIFLVRFIFFLIYFPGYFTWDSMYILTEAMDVIPLTNSHPYVYVYIIGLFGKIGLKLFGSVGVGLGIFNFLVMLFTSFTFSYFLYKLSSININKIFKVFVYCYFAFNPLFIFYSFILYKDVLLLDALLFFVLFMIEIMYTPKEFFENNKNLFLFVISFVSIYMLHRKAIIYVFVGSLSLLIYSKYKKIILKYILTSLVFCLFTNYLLVLILKPEPSSKPYDFLAPRFQQLGATVYYHKDYFTNEEIELYDNIFGLENTLNNFEYWSADNVKNTMDNIEFKKNFSKVFKMWLKGYKKYPKTNIEALLNLSVSYWYPYNNPDLVYYGNYYENMYQYDDTWLDYYNKTYYEKKSIGIVNRKPYGYYDRGWTQNYKFNENYKFIILKLIHRAIFWQIPDYPVISFLFRPGLFTWILLVCMMYEKIYKNNKVKPLLLMSISILLTCIYSPVVNYFRYSYLFVTIVPLIIPFVFIKDFD